MTDGRNREMILKVAFSLLLFSLLEQGVYGQCSTPPMNMAVYENTQNTMMSCNSPVDVSWSCKPTNDESSTYQITNFSNTVTDPSMASLFDVSQTNLNIKIAQAPSAAPPPIATSCLYVAQYTTSSTSRIGAKLVVVRGPTTCNCTAINSTSKNITCSIEYADVTIHPICAKVTWTADGVFIKNDTLNQTMRVNGAFTSTSTITTSVYDPRTYECKITFTKPMNIQYAWIATNEPTFSANCTPPCPQCLSNLKNIAVREGQPNTIMNLYINPLNVSWTVLPTSDESTTYDIIYNGGAGDPSLTNLYDVNQTGLVIKDATTTENGNPISTSGLYIGQCAGNTNKTGTKLLVVRSGPLCSCTPINYVSNVSCNVTYADVSIHPIYPIVTWKLNGVFLASYTLPRKKVDAYVFYAESTITTNGDSPNNYICELTFAAPTDIDFNFIATNAPEFNESCSTPVCGGALSTTEQSATTLSPTTTTSSIGYCFPNMKNIAVREGKLDVPMNVTASPCTVTWRVLPTSDELNGNQITSSNCTVDPTLAYLYYVNRSGLIIQNSTTTENGQPITTAGLYKAECNNDNTTMGAKLLIVRIGPECSCVPDNSSSTVQLSCIVVYADSTIHPIPPFMTWIINGVVYTTDEPYKNKTDLYVYTATSNITVDASIVNSYQCILTFGEPTDPQYEWIATNAPEFRESCSTPSCGEPIATTQSSTSSPFSTTATTTSTTGAYEQCFTSLRNAVVYEGTLNTMLNCATGPNSTTWSVKPTSNAGVYYQITSFDVVSPTLTGLYAISQTGVIVRNATTTSTDGPISTAGFYIVQFANGTNYMYTAAKLVVIRSGPNCSCIQSSSVDVISCTMIYADHATGPLNAIMNCTANGQLYTSSTPTKTLLPYNQSYYVYNSTSTITVSNTGPAIFDCLITFTAPTPHDPSYLATNAPDFNATSTVFCGTITTSQTLTTQSPTTTMATTSFRFSMEPLFGPVAGGTKITIIGSATIDDLSKYVGFNVTGVRNVYIGQDLSSTTVSLLTIGSSTFEVVAVTPSTTEASIGQPLPIIIEFSPTPFNMTFNKAFSYLPNPGITDIYPNIFIASGGTLLDVTGKSLSSVAKPIIQLTVVITRSAENNSTLNTSTTSTTEVCTVPPGNDTYMQCPMPRLSLPDDFLEILNSLYNISTSRRRRSRTPINQPNANPHSLLSRLKRDFSRNCVLSVNGPNGVDRADICLGISFDGYKEYENINDRLPDTKFIFYSAPEINKSNEEIEFDPSEDELIYVKGRYMLRGCLIRDYLVHIGNQICINDNLTDNALSCRPPKEKPSSTGNDSLHCGQHLSIMITLGYKQYQYACLTYPDNSKTFALIVGLTVGLAGFALFLTVFLACIVRCRRKKISQDTERHQTSGRQEIRNQHYNTDVEPEPHQDYIYTRQNTVSLYKPNDVYSNSIDEFHSNS